ncbi:MAG: hypothetical protein O2971_14705 [Proteobacteria bacterium]|nr:hypothetical protein [Pseudomonadota bacterium]
MKTTAKVLGFLLSLSLASNCLAQLQGDWKLTVTHDVERLGVLTVEESDDGHQVFVDGGPVAFTLEGNRLEMDADYRDGGGRLLNRHFTGTLDRDNGDSWSGTLVADHNGSTGTWRAERILTEVPLPPTPVDISGIWSRISAGMEKVHLDYTASAQAGVEDYSFLDDPALRCISPALVRISGWPYPLEILQNVQQVTILYESYHEVRRIFLDGRDFPESFPSSAMGYSIGHWEGSTLVVETSLLKPSFVDQAGQPVSENARVIERITLSDDGQNLRSLLTLHDPENYLRPIIRFRQWRRTPEAAIMEYDCDSYPFFRGLELEGKLDEYWERMRQLQ